VAVSLCNSLKFIISDHNIPGLVDFLKSYCKLCRVLADELCAKYSLEFSDLELEDISELPAIDFAPSGADELPNGNVLLSELKSAKYHIIV